MPTEAKVKGWPIEAKLLLLELHQRTLAIASAPAPPKGDLLGRATWEEERQYGPRYSPSAWFGEGQPLAEAARMRFLRAIHRLGAAGLLMMFRSAEGGRLENLRLTTEGETLATTWAAEAGATDNDEK